MYTAWVNKIYVNKENFQNYCLNFSTKSIYYISNPFFWPLLPECASLYFFNCLNHQTHKVLQSACHDNFIVVKVCNSANPTQLGFVELHTDL